MSSATILSNGCLKTWQTIIPYVPKSVVFLDSPVAEALHWTAGAGVLFQAQATNVKEFSSFESCSIEEKRGVFIISGQITGTAEEILEDIIRASHFQYCTLITSLPESRHRHLLGDALSGAGERSDHSFFVGLEEKMRGWMRHKSTVYEADVVHVPLSLACVSPGLFYLPEFTTMFPLLDIDLAAIKAHTQSNERKPPESLSEIDIDTLPTELQTDLKILVSNLSCLCETLDVNEDIYCLGPTSRIIASELARLGSARARRKAATNRASLLFVDRTLDMVAPTAHSRDSFADRIIAALPPLNAHSFDVAVDMSPLCSSGSTYNPAVLLPGCLAHPQDRISQNLLQTFITSKQKESLMDLNRRVVEAITREKLPFDPSAARIGRISAESLTAHLQHFKSSPPAFKHACPLLQVASACTQTLTSPALSRWDDLQTTEKLLLQNAGDGHDLSLPSLIVELLESQARQGRSYTLEETVQLLVHGYSLMGYSAAGTSEEERLLQRFITQQMTRAPSKSEIMRLVVGKTQSEAAIQRAAKEIISKAKAMSRARDQLQRFVHVIQPSSATHPATFSPLIKQVIEAVFDPTKPDLVDIEYKSSGFRDLLKTGFRLFMNVGKPRPSDHTFLIVFMAGGVTCSEVKHIKDSVASLSPNTQVIVGSTRILRETDVLGHIFGQEPLSY